MVRLVLALLYLAMAVGQLADVDGFVDILETFDVGPGRLWAVGLITAEVAAGFGLLTTRWRRPAASVGLGLAGAWAFLATEAFVRGLALDNCGCFGVYLAQELRWWILVEDLSLITSATLVWRASRSTPRLAGPEDQGSGDVVHDRDPVS